MYSLPVITPSSLSPALVSSVVPAVTTASVTTYPTTLMCNTLAPSIVYERRIGAPVYPVNIPTLGIELNPTITVQNKTLIDENQIDNLIKKKVEEQIKKYEEEEIENYHESSRNSRKSSHEITQFEICCKCCCQNIRSKEKKALTLDEKIQLIRESLNLPNEKDQDKLIKKLHEYQKRYEKCTIDDSDVKKIGNQRSHYKIDLVCNCNCNCKSTSRSRSRTVRTRSASRSSAKSRSPSASRPPWRPTGLNDYSSTRLKREELSENQRNYIPYDSEQSTSLVFFENLNKKKEEKIFYTEPKKTNLVTFQTFTPAKTIYTTTVDSKTKINSKPTLYKDCYVTTDYVTNHLSNTKPKTIVYQQSTKQPYYYEKSVYPLAKEYYYQPIKRSLSFHAKN